MYVPIFVFAVILSVDGLPDQQQQQQEDAPADVPQEESNSRKTRQLLNIDDVVGGASLCPRCISNDRVFAAPIAPNLLEQRSPVGPACLNEVSWHS